VLAAQDQLMGRELDRIEQIIWTLLTTGTFSVLLPSGGTGFTATFSLATYDATTWATVATATPLKDFRADADRQRRRGRELRRRARRRT
jgi:hypothetical protein